MLRNKFARHTIALISIALASVFLYPAARANEATLSWALLGVVGAAAILTLITK